nr:nucleocapsid protein [Chandipura virus]
MNSKVFCIATGQTVSVCLPANEDPVEFPSAFFTPEAKKPTVYIKKEADLSQLRSHVYNGLKDGSVVISHINSYLYLVLKDIQEKPDKNWTSFGVELGKKNEPMGIFDLLNVEDSKGQALDKKGQDTRLPGDDKWLPTLIFGLYRVSRATQVEYKKTLMTNLYAQCKMRTKDAEEIVDETAEFFNAWVNDSNFTKIVAAVDMYFHFFKKSDHAPIRFGTIVSRFKDCAALSTLSHLQKVTGLPVEEVFTWVFNKSVQDDLLRMMTPGQEIDQADSYMPYLIDLGLSTKSPYSSTKNPSFHFWGQLTAFLVKSARAKNALVPIDIAYHELTTAALLFAYAIGRSSELEQRFVLNGKKFTKEAGSRDDDDNTPPSERDVVVWLAWWEDVKHEITPDMKAFAKRAVERIGDIRVNSIAEYARKLFA